MSTRSPAQKAAWAKIVASRKKQGSLAIAVKRASPKVVRGKGAYVKAGVARGYGDYSMGKGDNSIGSRIGAFLGDNAQKLIKSVTGFGDYVKPSYGVKKNSLLSMGQDPPSVQNSKSGGFVVRHREYLQDVVTGTPGQFVVTAYRLQPGLQTSFPWLSVLAQNFEQYKLRGVIFEFKSTSADSLNTTNTALGEIIMATEYDCKKPPFSGKIEMQNHEYAVAARQSSSMLHPIECAHPLSPLDTLYCRSSQVPSGADQHLYDFANFQIATVGQQGVNVNIGELWVTYEIEFLKPQLQGEGNVLYSSVYSQSATSCSAVDYFGIFYNPSTFFVSPTNNLALKFGQTSITFSPDLGNGTYILDILWSSSTGGATVLTSFPIISPIGGSGIDLSSNSTPWGVTLAAPQIGATSYNLHMSVIIYLGIPTVPGTPRTLTFSGGVVPSGSTCKITVSSFLTGIINSGVTVPYVTPFLEINPVPKATRFGRDMRSESTEQAAVKSELDRLTLKLLQLEQIQKREESDEESEKEQILTTPIFDEDITKSTLMTMEQIVERAKAKKALLDSRRS